MEYRRLGRTGLDVSAVSLGTEYLIDPPREHVVGVIHEAIEQGINYFDLFFAQSGFRDTMGVAFKGHRERVFLAAHLGAALKDDQYKKTRTLKASEHFLELQRELVNTENRIQASRRFYNGNVRDMNTRVEVFPSNIIASLFGFEPQEFFEIQDAAVRAAPHVDTENAGVRP